MTVVLLNLTATQTVSHVSPFHSVALWRTGRSSEHWREDHWRARAGLGLRSLAGHAHVV